MTLSFKGDNIDYDWWDKDIVPLDQDIPIQPPNLVRSLSSQSHTSRTSRAHSTAQITPQRKTSNNFAGTLAGFLLGIFFILVLLEKESQVAIPFVGTFTKQ